ncbi:MAG: polysaccharide biosynthesis tyrosine autokinase [Crocinitomicaceae bacterium]|nr:polysaccharide biosynthesis tyrosine autokinase [Crocinitomicaceae bacterium]
MSNQQQHSSNKLIDSKDLLFVWRLIVKNLLILIFLPVFAYVVGFVYTHRLTEIYGAKVQFLLKSNETYDYQDKIYQGLGAYGVYMDVQNQMRVLKSRDLIGEVVDKINIGTSYYVVGRLKKQEVFEALPFKAEVTVLNPMAYENPVGVTILDQKSYKINYEINGESREFINEFGKELFTDDFILLLTQQYGFSDARIESIKSSEYEIVFHSRDNLISKYQSSIAISNEEFTSILDVTITDELQPRAKVFLDTLTDVYVDFSKRIQLEVNQNTIENIERQIDTVQVFIAQKERELLSYKDQHSILDPTKEGDQFFADYVTASEIKRELERKKNSAVALKAYLESTEDTRVLPPSFYIEETDFFLQEAVSDVRSKQVDLEIRMTHSTEENAGIVKLKKEISMRKQDVLKYIMNLVTAIEGEIKLKNDEINRYRYNVKTIPLSEQGIINIQRELDVNNNMYIFLLEKKTNTLITRAGIIPQVRVLETPSMIGAVKPDKKQIIRLFVLAGIVLSFFIALLKNVFFERLVSIDELRQTTILNVIGGVPFYKKQSSLIAVNDSPKSQITESFRSIRTNLSFMKKEKQEGLGQKILISSYFPGEGKTYCSTNLAVLISRSEKKTVLVDFDLHKPKVHKMFAFENNIGTTSYIIGKSSLEEITHKNVFENFDVITAGPISPNPSELILKNKVDQMLAELSKKYDYVIVDTPPFGLLNDTLELSKKIDTFLVVLNTKYTRRRGIKAMEGILEKYEDISKGLILNGIKENKIKYYYSRYVYKYTYGYNYGYNYGYGDEYGNEKKSD